MGADWSFAKPLSVCFITESWGHERNRGLHGGIDLRAAVGTPVFAVASGTVQFGGQYSDGSGGAVELVHDDGLLATRYLHLSSVFTKTGAKVSKGQQIGTSGFATSPHLHFDTWILGNRKADYVTKFGAFVGTAGNKAFRGVTYTKVPSEPLIPGATYQPDVVAMMAKYGVPQYSLLKDNRTYFVAGAAALVLAGVYAVI